MTTFGSDVAGAVIADDAVLDPTAFIDASAVVGATSHATGAEARPVVVGKRVLVGANATIMRGVVLADGCIVEPGAVVTRSVPQHAVVAGNPAVIVGYHDAGRPLTPSTAQFGAADPQVGRIPSRVEGVALHRFPRIDDMRGALTAAEFESFVPFLPRRYFLVYGVPGSEVRGEHSHRRCHQFLVCVTGEVRVVADDGEQREEFLLDHPSAGLHLPPRVWGIQYGYSPGSVLLVFASDPYDPDDYIRDYAEFLDERRRTSADS